MAYKGVELEGDAAQLLPHQYVSRPEPAQRRTGSAPVCCLRLRPRRPRARRALRRATVVPLRAVDSGRVEGDWGGWQGREGHGDAGRAQVLDSP